MIPIMRTILKIALIGLVLPLPGCGEDDVPQPPYDGHIAKRVVQRHIARVGQAYKATLIRTAALHTAVSFLAAEPSADALGAARAEWRRARELYGQLEAFRFSGGPIDTGEDAVEGLMNAWPMDEAYMDAVEGRPGGGIIGDTKTYPEITRALLLELHEQGGEENVATGWHALEFLLWGQDLSETGPGARPHTDFDPKVSPTAKRRAQYAMLACDLLAEHLHSLEEAWNPKKEGSYAQTFAALPTKEALRRMWNGITRLVVDELASERMFVAYDTQDQENEQSCFSDTTRADLIANFDGIFNVYTGRFADEDGVGLDEFVAAFDPALDERIQKAMRAAQTALLALPDPLDRVIRAPEGSASRKKFKAAIDAMRALGTTLTEAAGRLGLRIDAEAEAE